VTEACYTFGNDLSMSLNGEFVMLGNKWEKLGSKIDSKILSSKRRLIREKFGVSNSVPVIFEENIEKPTLEGYQGGWYTKGGKKIRFPSAYSKIGMSNMVYKRSTLLIRAAK